MKIVCAGDLRQFIFGPDAHVFSRCLLLPLLKDFSYHGKSGEYVRPTGIEGDVGDDFSGLRLCQAIVHRPVKVIGGLGNLTRCNESTDSHEAAIPWCQRRAEPKFTEQKIRCVLHEPR
jgi:hypothetical protein